MGSIIDKITEFIKEMLQGWVLDNLGTMFTDVNTKVGEIAGEVGQTPSAWNGSIFSMIRNLSENVMIPIAGLIISAILCYELITMAMDKNNMHEVGSEFFFTVILYGRMIEIYLYISVAPVPFATLSNREWGSIGSNYIKGLCALAFQGFFIMVCVGIYSVLVASVAVASNLHTALWSVAAYTVILCFSLFKTGSLAKSVLNAH